MLEPHLAFLLPQSGPWGAPLVTVLKVKDKKQVELLGMRHMLVMRLLLAPWFPVWLPTFTLTHVRVCLGKHEPELLVHQIGQAAGHDGPYL